MIENRASDARRVRHQHIPPWPAMILGLGMLMVGCGGGNPGPKREAISGSVTREGIAMDNGTILMEPTAGGPGASTEIKGGKYQFTSTNGPVAGGQKVTIVYFEPRGEGPPGTPKKDLPIVKDTRFKKEMPPNGWKQDAEVKAGQSDPLDFKVE